jgi:hypothetical protein
VADGSAIPTKIPQLTGIRGVAACWVFGFHMWLVAGSPTIHAWNFDVTPFLGCGWAGGSGIWDSASIAVRYASTELLLQAPHNENDPSAGILSNGSGAARGAYNCAFCVGRMMMGRTSPGMEASAC